MRIITGVAKGRKLVSPDDGTRPMTGRAREALFSSLSDLVVSARVLDLYAGTGALGLEALSRGASGVTFVESGPAAVSALKKNVASVGLGGRVVVADVAVALEGMIGPYDLVFVDPPYALSLASVEDVLSSLTAKVAPGGTVVLHRPSGEAKPTAAGLLEVDRRKYGGTTLWRYVKEEA